MSNPPMTPSPMPQPKGGMPKWLIILLVILLLIILGCCGGFTLCTLLVRKGVTVATQAAPAIEQQIQDRAQQAARDAATRAANGGGGGDVLPADGGGGGGGGAGMPRTGGGSNSNGGSSSGGSGGGSGAGDGGMLIPGRLPSNFPSDIPVMSGLTPTALSASDNIAGSGMAALTSTSNPGDIVSFYKSSMKDQGWTIDGDVDAGKAKTMTFNKDGRKAQIQVITADNKTTVIMGYQAK